MSAKQKQNLLHQPETPVIYKLDKGVSIDNSTTKENLITVNPQVGNTAINLNGSDNITFHFSDSTKLLLLSSNQSGFRVKIRFKTKEQPAGARNPGDPFVDNNVANITLANSWF